MYSSMVLVARVGVEQGRSTHWRSDQVGSRRWCKGLRNVHRAIGGGTRYDGGWRRVEIIVIDWSPIVVARIVRVHTMLDQIIVVVMGVIDGRMVSFGSTLRQRR